MTTKELIAYQLTNGALQMPTITPLKEEFGPIVYAEIEAMFKAMWHTYLRRGAHLTPKGDWTHVVSMPYWAQRIANPRAHNIALKLLSESNWITVSTRPNSNWSEAWINETKLLTYVDQSTLDHVRMFNKFVGYKLTSDLSNNTGNVTCIKGKRYTDKGITRNGFAKAGNTEFAFDTVTMLNHKHIVAEAVNKGIEKMVLKYPQIATDHANYKELGSEVVDAYIYEADHTYRSGSRTNDPRGRDNAGYLSKIGNPIGFKVMRSLLVIPEAYRNQATATGLNNKYMFIAQLLGFKGGTKQDKINMGKLAYMSNQLHTAEYTEDTAEEWFENIWLERLYADIDSAYGNRPILGIVKRKASIKTLDTLQLVAYKWQVPIEIDASASVLGFIGILLNHKPFLDRCNITQGNLTDAWGHDVITNRKQFKTIMRQCYGSQMSAQDMWRDMKITFTQDEVDAFNYEMKHGDLAVAIAFKDFIIDNAQMQETMQLHVLNEQATTHCNRFHNVGELTTEYDLYNSATKGIRTIHNTSIKQVADLKSFKRYAVTGLIHNLDSQVMNNTADAVMEIYNWCLPIHDAAIICCEAADYTREVYANGRTADEPSLKSIHTNRNKILTNYFRSLNIPASKVSEWKKVTNKVIPFMEELVINPLVLK